MDLGSAEMGRDSWAGYEQSRVARVLPSTQMLDDSNISAKSPLYWSDHTLLDGRVVRMEEAARGHFPVEGEIVACNFHTEVRTRLEPIVRYCCRPVEFYRMHASSYSGLGSTNFSLRCRFYQVSSSQFPPISSPWRQSSLLSDVPHPL